MVALALGLLLTAAMVTVYVTSKSSFTRQQQLSTVQQSARVAFEYLTSDARMVGHLGCFTGKTTNTCDGTVGSFCNTIGTVDVRSNYAVGIEGYEYTPGAYTLTSNSPADITTAGSWSTNVATNGGATNAIPVTTIGGAAGLTPGSDVLLIRTVSGRPVRLATQVLGTNQTTLSMENVAGGTCSDGTTAKVSGLCPNSHVLLASCKTARVFDVQTLSAASPSTLTVRTGTNLGADPIYPVDGSEVFPMQTIAYYVKQSSSGTGTSLYRRIFDGDNANGVEQELIEGVENMQIRYGVDTTAPDPDGVVDLYVAAKGTAGNATDSVTDWSRVVALRMSLLMRSATPVQADTSVATTATVGGVTITYPTTGDKFDRRVFTTTVAVRNRISYF
ncbi:MAG: hypothetical protein AD742_10795 [Methylibium sp. NZG]|nr:MAG: hypothetical protein AD742_10795 [Methylibium sp. NZG]